MTSRQPSCSDLQFNTVSYIGPDQASLCGMPSPRISRAAPGFSTSHFRDRETYTSGCWGRCRPIALNCVGTTKRGPGRKHTRHSIALRYPLVRPRGRNTASPLTGELRTHTYIYIHIYSIYIYIILESYYPKRLKGETTSYHQRLP